MTKLAPIVETVDWPGCEEATITTYDFSRQAGEVATEQVVGRPTKLESLVEKVKLYAGLACIAFIDKE